MKSEMQKGFEAQRASGINVDWFTWQIAWSDARALLASEASAAVADTAGAKPVVFDGDSEVYQCKAGRLSVVWRDIDKEQFDSLPEKLRRVLYASHADAAGENVTVKEIDLISQAIYYGKTNEAYKRLDDIRVRLLTSPAIDTAGAKPIVVTDEMVSRFLGWKLPQDFYPDCFVTFDREKASAHAWSWPSGTNLLHAGQARAMLEHVLDAAPAIDTAGAKLNLQDVYTELRDGFSVSDAGKALKAVERAIAKASK